MLNYFFKRQADNTSTTQAPTVPKQFSSKTEQEPLYALINKDFLYCISKNFVECFYASPVENTKTSPAPSTLNTPSSASSLNSSSAFVPSYHLPGERKWLYRVFEYIHLCAAFHFDLQYIVCGCDDDQVRVYEFVNQKPPSATLNTVSNTTSSNSSTTIPPDSVEIYPLPHATAATA